LSRLFCPETIIIPSEEQIERKRKADNYMKNRLILITLLLSVIALLLVQTAAVAESVGWYTVRSGGEVPPLPEDLAFLEDYSGYYVDRSATDADKRIYLTFDAGYENGNVAKILDVLAEKKVNGTFFILENLVKRDPALVKRMRADGHVVANHSATHPDMTGPDEDGFRAELDRMDACYRELCGEPIARYYRPPEGKLSRESLGFAERMGYKTVMWSFAYADWDNNAQPDPDAAIEKIISNTHNGMIILLHPTSATNAAIIGRLIDEWRDMGYRFATVDELK